MPDLTSLLRRAAWALLIVPAATLFLACGKGDPAFKGTYHPTTWLAEHPAQALSNLDHCKTCHEMTVLKVGSAIPNCMTAACHHGTIPGFSLAALHGLRAKAHADATGGGMASCQACHGQDFAGGGSAVACASCHGVAAPHPARPWNDATGATLSHSTTDPSNAATCAQCHFPGAAANPAGHPATPAPAGTVPTCFNNTLCHGSATPHPLGSVWKDPTSPAFHGLVAKQDLLYCQTCHGVPGSTSFAGGSTTTACASCHVQAFAHSDVWSQAPQDGFPPYVQSHRDAHNRDNACPVCHDYVKGRTAPLPAAPSCFSSSANAVACHANGPGQPNHPIPFTGAAHTAATQASFDGDCATCHAVSGASPLSGAPLCATCHTASSPLATANCASCHEKPPATGAAFPDLAGSHPQHDALASVTGACSTCHTGSESGTLAHYGHANARSGMNTLRVPPAPVAFPLTYQGKAGTASMNTTALTCSNVSCHGGITTPAWGTPMDVSTEAACLQCHQVGSAPASPENNSASSGLHGFHMGSSVGASCLDCHAMGNGSAGALNHFAHLDTPQMEGPASDTILLLGNSGNTYDKANQTCTVTCHNTQHTALSWKGGPAHPMPFVGANHTSVSTQTAFNANCASCHAATGTSPIPSAPACAVCHQAASPLTAANCTSCHAKPPSGSAFPNNAGTHAAHNALVNLTGACTACHTGFDSGSQAHYDHANARPGKDALRVAPAPTGFASIFNARAGGATLSAGAYTCSNVSCHGGLAAPDWRVTGSIDFTGATGDTGCRKCHAQGTAAGTPEYNSFYSGRHSAHLGSDIGAKCTDCHSMTNNTDGAKAHFAHLDTTIMEGPASDTIQYNGSRAVYTANGQTCTLTCHNKTHSSYSWTGGN